MNLRELMDRRANLVAEARALLESAGGENRDMTQEETNRYDAIMADVSRLGMDIQRRQQLAAYESAIREQPGTPPDVTAGPEDRAAAWQGEQRRRVTSFLRDFEGGSGRLELRALQADADIYGGYLVQPVQFVNDMIKAVDNLVFVRQWATIYRVPNAESLGAPALDNNPADPTWTSELAVGSEETTMSFGKRELYPHPLAQYIKVSRKLIRQVPDVEALVRDRLAYKFSVVEENAFLNGSGSGEPLGVFTASSVAGISTSQDVSTGNATTYPTFDGLIEAKYKLKQQYWGNSRWMFHQDCVKLISKLVDGEGQYIWSESVRVGEPDRILGIPVFMSQYVPNTMTTGLYVGILGDWRYYWIADALDMELQRLVELYAATNQVGIIGRLECDGMPVLEEAFVRVKLG